MSLKRTFELLCWSCLSYAGVALAAVSPASEPASEAGNGDGCLESVLRPRTGRDTSLCDIEIQRLNGELNRSAAQNTALAAAYQNRADLHLRAAQFERAEADLGEALRLRADFAAAYVTRGNLRLTQTRFAEALADYDAAIRLTDARLPQLFVNRALALRGLGEIAAAAIDIERAGGGRSPLSPSGTDAAPAAGSRSGSRKESSAPNRPPAPR